jgi:hypothetical protein
MRVEDLHHEELLDLDPVGGVIRFAGQRALLLDAVPMGILRQYLVEKFGLVGEGGASDGGAIETTQGNRGVARVMAGHTLALST